MIRFLLALPLLLPIAARAQSTTGGTAGFPFVPGQFACFASTVGDIAPCRNIATMPAPTIIAQNGAGTSPTGVTVVGVDSGFIVSVTTGTSPLLSASILAVTFGTTTHTFMVNCAFSAANAAAAALSGASSPYETTTLTKWQITSGPTALAASTAYSWMVVCGP